MQYFIYFFPKMNKKKKKVKTDLQPPGILNCNPEWPKPFHKGILNIKVQLVKYARKRSF